MTDLTQKIDEATALADAAYADATEPFDARLHKNIAAVLKAAEQRGRDEMEPFTHCPECGMSMCSDHDIDCLYQGAPTGALFLASAAIKQDEQRGIRKALEVLEKAYDDFHEVAGVSWCIGELEALLEEITP